MNKRHERLFLSKWILCTALAATAMTLPAWAKEEEKTEAERARIRAEEEERNKAQAELKSQFPYSFNDVSDKIVIIECKSDFGDWSGSGFIATMDGKTYIFTNQHVMLGAGSPSFKTASGEVLHPVAVELSVTRDICRLLIPDHDAFVISPRPSIDMLIAVFGNSEGGGVATELYGKVTGMGSDLVEVTADFVPGNSGSPALNPDKEAIGIVSYVKFSVPDESTKDEEAPEKKARRFCYRLTDVQWAHIKWNEYNEDYGRAYRETEELVDSIFDVVYGWGDDPFGYVPRDYKNYDLKKWAKAHNSMVDKIVRLSDKGVATQKELDNTNKQISKDIGDSADALSVFCMRKSRQIELKLSKKDLTGFLREEFEGYVDALEYASKDIDRFGGKLAGTDYFHFK